MIRKPKACGDNAWRSWCKRAFVLLDRAWSGWALVWWALAALMIYGLQPLGPIYQICILACLSPAAFGGHIAILDSLARGEVSIFSQARALRSDMAARWLVYLRTGVLRVLVVVLSLLFLGLVFAWLQLGSSPKTPPPASIPTWNQVWTSWVWMWVIPAGWQWGGALGWAHWLVRRERMPRVAASALIREGFVLNSRACIILPMVLIIPALVLLYLFPPLLPLWDLYAAAVCWCVWDDVFGPGEGLQAVKRVAVASAAPSAV